MNKFALSERALDELRAISEYGIEIFGVHQASRYFEGLQKTFARLANQPRMGRIARNLGGDVRRHEHRAHVIFYEEMPGGIFVLRILHKSQLELFGL